MIDQIAPEEDLKVRIQQLEHEVEVLKEMFSNMQSEMAIVYDMQEAIASISKIQQTFGKIRDAFN